MYNKSFFYQTNFAVKPKSYKTVLRTIWKIFRIIVLVFMLTNFFWGLGVLFFRQQIATTAITDNAGKKDFVSGTFFEILAGYQTDLTFKNHIFHYKNGDLYQYHYYGANNIATIWNYSHSIFHVCFAYPISWIMVKISYGFGWSSSKLNSQSNLLIMIAAIFLISLLIRLLVGYNAWTTYLNSDKMKLVQQKSAEIKYKYRDRNDFRSKQAMQLEIMKMYRKMNINPTGNALNSFLFTPFLFAIFIVVRTTRMIKDSNSIDFSLTRTVWDSLKAFNWIYLLPAAIYLCMFLFDNFLIERIFKQPKKTVVIKNPKTESKSRKFLFKWVFKIMFLVFFFIVPTGTSIYWIFSSFFEIMQKIIFFYLLKWVRKRRALIKKGIVIPWKQKLSFTPKFK